MVGYREEALVRTCAVIQPLAVPEIGADGDEQTEERCATPTDLLCVACLRPVCRRHLAPDEAWCVTCHRAFRSQLGELATPCVEEGEFRRLRVQGLSSFAVAIVLVLLFGQLFPGSAIIYLAAIPQVFGIDRLYRVRDEARRRRQVEGERRRFLAAQAERRALAPGADGQGR